MEIFQDSFFTIGKTHKICQDYALVEPGILCVSDGCSSSPNTDFGSRILVRCAMESFVANGKIVNDAVIEKCFECCQILNLPMASIDATLLFCNMNVNGFNVTAIGDGTIVARKKDKTVVIKTINYKGNAPLYLSYFFNDGRKKARTEMFDCTKTIKTIIIKPGLPTVESEEISVNDIELLQFSTDEYEMITLMTDGIDSFAKESLTQTTKTVEPYKSITLIENLIDYKNYNGQFVQRRCQKYLKECQDQKIMNNDDFTIATIFTR